MSSDKIPFSEKTLTEQEQILLNLAKQALAAWDLDGELSLIKQRENAVYALVSNSGERYALRVHRANYHSNAALDSELEWMNALADFGLKVPTLIPTTSGDSFTIETVDGIDQARQVDLLAWLDGTQIGSVEDGLGNDEQEVKHIYTTIGEIAAQVHNQASQWMPSKGFERHSWDIEGLVGEQPLWGQFWKLDALDAEQRGLVLEGREAIAEGLKAFGQRPDNYSLIHADFVPENIMMYQGEVQIIDFDDAGFGWHMFELATALYFIQGEAMYEAAKDALIAGYRSRRTLSDDDLAQLSLFLAARSLTYLGWVHTRQGTQTAVELTPLLIEMSCDAIRCYLDRC